ncbi:phage holin family protein [Xenophilus sp.]|uniref:phage holin family protein n=1 Tax=Xenophilus sp. TaxID=1873499 RepID=UPI0037DDA012
MKRLLGLFGIDERIARVRSAVGEGVIAAEDRAQLVRMALADLKTPLQRMAALLVALVGLTIVMAVLLSLAVIVHFWDTPQRSTAAWIVALVWIVLWAGALVGLVTSLRGASSAVQPAQLEFERDIEWLQARFGDEDKPREPRPATLAELVDRIEGQRRRLVLAERLEAAAEAAQAEAVAAGTAREPLQARATRMAREHPVAAGAAAAVLLAAVGPRRVLKAASWALPILWKLR